MATATGWTFQVIDEMLLDDVYDLVRYWESVPPPHVSLARIHAQLQAFFESGSSQGSKSQDLSELFSAFPGGEIRS